jgi:hypothetical protein
MGDNMSDEIVKRGRPKKAVDSYEEYEVPVEEQEPIDLDVEDIAQVVKEEISKEILQEDIIPEDAVEEIVEKETSLPSSACIECSYRYKSSVCKSCVENVRNK